MTRIEHGSTELGLAALSSLVREALNTLIDQVCSDSQSDPLEILDVVIQG